MMKKYFIFLFLANIIVVMATNAQSNSTLSIGSNMITNGSFDSDDSGWSYYFDYFWDPGNPLAAKASVSVVTKDGFTGKAYNVSIQNAGTANYSVQISYPMPLVAGATYQIKFKASADASRVVAINLQQNVNPKTNWFLSQDITLTTTPTTFGPFSFTAKETDLSNLFKLYLGGRGTGNAIAAYFDDIEVAEVVDVVGATVPDAPTLVKAKAGDGLSMIEFTSPTNTGGIPIRYYKATSNPDGITAMGTTSPIKMEGLTNGKAYSLTVSATNAMGNSVSSIVSNAVTPAHQATAYFVSSLIGNDNNDGKSKTTPFKFIQSASKKAIPGDTIFIMNGTYEPLTISTAGDPVNRITYKSFPGHKPIITCGLSGAWNLLQISASYITIDGIEVKGINPSLTLAQGEKNYNDILAIKNSGATPTQEQWNNTTNTNTNGISIGVANGTPIQNVTVKNCKVHDCSAGGFGGTNADDLLIENNEIFNNCLYSMWATSGISLINMKATTPAGNAIIRGNKVYNNYCLVKWINIKNYSDGNGIIIDVNTGYSGSFLIENNLVFDNGGRGLYIMTAQNAIFRNNTSYWNSKSSFSTGGEMVVFDSKNVTYVNNIAWANPAYSTNNYALDDDGFWGNNSNITWKNNITYNGTDGNKSINLAKTTTKTIDNSNISGVNPLFVSPSIDPTIADFNLQGGSPAINKGTSDLKVSDFDINYKTRVLEGAVDMGAYESFLTSNVSIANTMNIKVFPSPVVDKIIVVNAESLNIKKIELYSINGKLLQVVTTIDPGKNVIDLQSESKGVYILKIYTPEQIYFRKIVKG